MENAARKLNLEQQFEYIELEDNKQEEKSFNKVKLYAKVMAYSAVFLLAGVFHVNSIIQKTNITMELEKMKKNVKMAENEISFLKSELDVNIDLKKMEEVSRNQIKMEITKDIKYIKLR